MEVGFKVPLNSADTQRFTGSRIFKVGIALLGGSCLVLLGVMTTSQSTKLDESTSLIGLPNSLRSSFGVSNSLRSAIQPSPMLPKALVDFQTLALAGYKHNPRVHHISCRARNGDSRITVRADDIEEKVKKLVAENLSVDEEKITPEASFIEDLGADSLDTVELLMAMEEEFGCEIPEEEAQKLTTVKAVIEYAKDKA